MDAKVSKNLFFSQIIFFQQELSAHSIEISPIHQFLWVAKNESKCLKIKVNLFDEEYYAFFDRKMKCFYTFSELKRWILFFFEQKI